MVAATGARELALSVLQVSAHEERVGPNEAGAKQIATAFGIAVPHGVFVEAAADLRVAAAGLRPPLVLKVMSPDVVHKTEFKAVRVGIKDLDELIGVRDRMMQEPQLASVRLDGFLVEEMVDASWELVIGGKIDESFGPVLMLGIGGILLEVLDDVAFRVCPVDRADVEGMLNQLRARRLLDGYRGMPSVDIAAIVDAAVALGGADGLLCALADSVLEVDINPLMVGPDGATAADVRIVGRKAALDAMEMTR